MLISQLIKGSKENFFIKPNFRRKYQTSSSGQKFFGKKKTFVLKKTFDIFVKNLVNKKILLTAFYQLTYQHDSKDFNICNYKHLYVQCSSREAGCKIALNFLLGTTSEHKGKKKHNTALSLSQQFLC